jgi:hypothetical protein
MEVNGIKIPSVFGVQGNIPLSGQMIPLTNNGPTYVVRMSTNLILMYPFIPVQNITIGSLSINVTVSVAGANARILLYDNTSGTYGPNNKILETTNLDCSTNGIKTFTYSYTFTAGTVYWFAVYTNSTPTITHIQPNFMLNLRISSDFTATTCLESSNYSFGSAPNTFPTITTYTSKPAPFVGLSIV